MNDQIKHVAFLSLTEMCSTNKKTCLLSYSKLMRASYLSKFKPKVARMVFIARVGVYDIKDNFKRKHDGDLNSPFCRQLHENFEHIFQCNSGIFCRKSLRGTALFELELWKGVVQNHRPPTTDHRPPTTYHRPPTTDHRPPLIFIGKSITMLCNFRDLQAESSAVLPEADVRKRFHLAYTEAVEAVSAVQYLFLSCELRLCLIFYKHINCTCLVNKVLVLISIFCHHSVVKIILNFWALIITALPPVPPGRVKIKVSRWQTKAITHNFQFERPQPIR